MLDAIRASRRGVLTFLGVSPLAAKTAADEVLGKLSGVGVDGLRRWGMTGKPSPSGGWGVPEQGSEDDPHAAARLFVRTSGLPSWTQDIFREMAWNVAALDPDIANKRSWSMAVKVLTQRTRNYDRLVAQIDSAATRSLGRKAFRTLTGCWWPY